MRKTVENQNLTLRDHDCEILVEDGRSLEFMTTHQGYAAKIVVVTTGTALQEKLLLVISSIHLVQTIA